MLKLTKMKDSKFVTNLIKCDTIDDCIYSTYTHLNNENLAKLFNC